MRKSLLAALTVFLLNAFSSQSALSAYQSVLPSPAERDAALAAVKGLSFVFDDLKGETFAEKTTHWEKTINVQNQAFTIVVFEQKGKGIVNVAFTSPSVKLGNVIAAADRGAFGDVQLKNATTIVVSPNSPLGEKQGAVEIEGLPAPIANAIKPTGVTSIELPTGLFTINQFQPGQSSIVEDVFKTAGLTYPVTSYASLDAGNYMDLLSGKAALSLSILLTENNGIARLVELTRLMEIPKGARPVLTIFGSTRGGEIGVAYESPYLVMGKGPVDTTMLFAMQETGLAAELTVAAERWKDPVIVPRLVELEDVTLEDLEITIGLEAGAKTMEVTAGIAAGKMGVKRTTYEPARLQLAMTPAGPSGALFEIKSRDTIGLAEVVDLAEVAVNANPGSKIVPGWARRDIAQKLRLDELPVIGIAKPHIYVATPGQDDSNHLADFAEIAGAGVKIKGDVIVFDQTLAHTDLGLDVVDGLKAYSKIRPIKAGTMELKHAEMDIRADTKKPPHFKIHGEITVDDVTFRETELKFSRNGFKWTDDQGCLPPMMRVSMETKAWKPVKGGLRPSDCAERLAKEVEKVAKAAGKQIGNTAGKAANGAKKAAKKAGKLVADAADAAADAEKAFKKFGCKAEDAFTGGKCSKRKKKKKKKKAKKKRKKALARAKEYRKIVGPGHCGNGWVWNHKYRTCWRSGGYRMMFYAFDGAENGRCMEIKGAKNKPGQPLQLWNCNGRWDQQFRTMPWRKGGKDVWIVTARGLCVTADIRQGKTQAAPIVLSKCAKSPGQKWRLIGGRLVGYRDKCLRSSSFGKKGSRLVLEDCDADLTTKPLKKEIANLDRDIAVLKKKIASLKKQYRKAKKKAKRRPPFARKAAVKTAKWVYKKKVKPLKKKRAAKKERRTVRKAQLKNHLSGTGKTPPVEWVNAAPRPNPEKNYFAKYQVPSSVMLKITNKYCLDKTGSQLPKARPHLWKCKKKNRNQHFGIGIVKGQYIALVSEKSKMCLEVKGKSKKKGARVIQYPCHYGKNQQWIAVSPGDRKTDGRTFDGRFLIKNRNSGKCLGIKSSKKVKRKKHFMQVKCKPNERRQLFKVVAR